ncbi:peptidase domain-containing ABC transporter [Dendronalium sp. ChiSLP03b]|uniref:peptidase domain-containing ABC transporter n=1 Tax=Dendronalium sp. ChiSLP03b TaxID=3075381 RepID=UPI002AD4383B|nr:peptidase domain-containing ABC transporter [Dendronalium sp. ChiSLP03b]MDZ8205669.1 peptidase domain-containing ABC transporter [Dendronalium sp. ChiSLP03b]
MKYQIVLQHSEADCGAACLASISRYYGLALSLNRVREAVGTGQLGTTLLGLRRGAESLGFNARSVRASSEILPKINQIPLPAVIHWKGYHWVVLYGQRGSKYVIADPAVGMRYLSKQQLMEGWKDWVILLQEPDPSRFFNQSNEQVDSFGKWLMRLWLYRAILAEALLCAFVIGLLSLASPFLIQILTDDVLIRGDTQLLAGVALAVMVIALVRRSLTLVQKNLIAHFAQRFELGLILEFGQQILQLPLTYYETRRSGEIVSRLRDIHEINRLISRTVISLPSEFFIAVVSLSFMLFYSLKLTLVGIFIALTMTLSTVIFLPALQRKNRNVLVLEAENQGILVETFKGALTIKTTTAAPQFWEEFQSRFNRLTNLTLRTVQISIVNNIFSSIVSDIGSVALLWYGSNLTISKELSIGQLLAFTSLNRNVGSLIGSLVDFVDEFTRVKTATSRLQEVITSTPETLDDAKKHWLEIPGKAEIVCTQVTFHYPGRPELLENFSITIPAGKVTALIGESGCGKSTLSKLIAGLYSLQSGNIRIGIYNLQDISLDCLRQQVVLVPQEAHFWSRSIVENFRLGSPYATFEQIVKACQIAAADEFISKLPDKYQTVLGEFGTNISGGQRQRLALARAIVNDPPILILDESTSGLDPVSEAKVLHQLLSHRQGKTTILISHRPRVINKADWIVLLEQGKLKLEGSLEELRSQHGDHLDFLTP